VTFWVSRTSASLSCCRRGLSVQSKLSLTLADRARSRLPALAAVDSPTRLDAWTISSKLSGLLLAIVDTGPLYAVADLDDQDHDRCLAVLQRSDLELVVPALVVAEATYLIGTRLGSSAEAQFLRALGVVRSRTGRPYQLLPRLSEVS
jgi:hypothetical protein